MYTSRAASTIIAAILARAWIVATAAAARPRTSEASIWPMATTTAALKNAAPAIAVILRLSCWPLHHSDTFAHAKRAATPRPAAQYFVAVVAPASMSATLCGGPVRIAPICPDGIFDNREASDREPEDVLLLDDPADRQLCRCILGHQFFGGLGIYWALQRPDLSRGARI